MDQPKSQFLTMLVPGFRMHTQMFDNMLKGITEEEALKRINNSTNHVVWMAGNLVNCRYWYANVLGISDPDPNAHYFKDGKTLDLNANYPELKTIKEEWHRISPKLYQALLKVADDDVKAGYDFGEMEMPFVAPNILNAIGMGFDRESYLLGQLGLMRKLLGHPGVSYEIDATIKY